MKRTTHIDSATASKPANAVEEVPTLCQNSDANVFARRTGSWTVAFWSGKYNARRPLGLLGALNSGSRKLAKGGVSHTFLKIMELCVALVEKNWKWGEDTRKSRARIASKWKDFKLSYVAIKRKSQAWREKEKRRRRGIRQCDLIRPLA